MILPYILLLVFCGIMLVLQTKDTIKPRKTGIFEPVNFLHYNMARKEMLKEAGDDEDWGAEIMREYFDTPLPRRATAGSAGYDFFAPFAFTLAPGETIKIPTGVRVMIDNGWWLGCLPRSGLGFKYRVQLDNTMGVIDSDYYYADNGGQIFIKMTNHSPDKTLEINAGDAIAQGIFLPYGITYGDNAKEKRTGGMGSTDNKPPVITDNTITLSPFEVEVEKP